MTDELTLEHLSEDELLAFVDRAVGPDRAMRVGRHLDACAECSGKLAEVRALSTSFRNAVQIIDAVEPRAWSKAPAAAPLARRSLARPIEWARWAAVLFFCAAGVASAATLWRAVVGPSPVVQVPNSAPSAPNVAATSAVIVPVEDSVSVTVSAAGRGSLITITRDSTATEGMRVDVGGVGTPAFRPGQRSLSIGLGGHRATVHVAVPARVRVVRIEANGHVIAHLVDGVVTPAAAREGGVVVSW